MVCSATDFYNSVISVPVCLMLLLVDEKVSKKLYQVCNVTQLTPALLMYTSGERWSLRSITRIKGSPEKSIFATINVVSPISSTPFLFLHATKTLQHPVFIMCSTICKTVQSTKGVQLFASTFLNSARRHENFIETCVPLIIHPISTREICTVFK